MLVERSLFPGRAAEGPFVRVVVERGMDAPGGLTYCAPAGLRDLSVGERVVVPLGRREKKAEGFVVEVNIAPDLDLSKIKAVAARTGSALPPRLVELARWMSRYYCCPIGMTLATMMPAAVKRGVGATTRTLLERTGAPPEGGLAPSAQRAWGAVGALPESAFPIGARELADRVGERTVGPINRLIRAGLLREVERRSVRAGETEQTVEAPVAVELTDAQARAVEAVGDVLGSFSAHLLFGVTGSGKTEVYLRLIERVALRGEAAIVLVPEISLTPQTAARFLGRLGHVGVAVLHSGLTAAQRHKEWARVASGEARVVVGARSAVFAPYGPRGDGAGVRLGLIVVDEEHDGAYKQGELPRHHARDVAVKRAQIEGCPVVLGSATPSLESWHNAAQGRFTLHEIPERAGGASLPRVEIVDLVEELRSADSHARLTLIGPRLREAIGRTLDEEGAQVILLLNRRGYANYIACPDQRCGWFLTCEHCDSTMTHHKDGAVPGGAVVRCHHCLAEKRVPAQCPQCGKIIVTFGAGTQRLEEELPRLFPRLTAGDTMLRVDSDTMQRAADYHGALSRFRSGAARALLGTQMIAKGLDFPHVRLVGVINADTAINLPDFRAAERTFQMVSQVAGRAGRDADGGQARVLVQTFNPHAPAIRLAAAHDFRGFAGQEIGFREGAHLPPCGRMARVVVRHGEFARAMETAGAVAHALREAERGEARDAGVRVRGPMPCALSRLHGKHRIAVEVMARTAGPIQRMLAAARERGLVKSDTLTAVDVDPVDLL